MIKPLLKKPLLISGYETETVFEEESKTYNEYFNESAVEMFVAQDEEYREEKVLNYKINTNQDLNEGIYCLNSNLIHQMLIARGISEEEFYKGLYNYKISKQIMGKFKKGTFKKLSSNMDTIFEELKNYYNIEDKIYKIEESNNSADTSQLKNEMNKHKSKLENTVSSSERMIIDKILLPRLKRVPLNEKQKLLDEYYKFIISEREYFKSKTNYQVFTVPKKKKWLPHIDVEPLSPKLKSNRDIFRNKERVE